MPSDFAIVMVMFLIWVALCISDIKLVVMIRSIILILAFVYLLDTGFRDLGEMLFIFSPWIVKKLIGLVKLILIVKER